MAGSERPLLYLVGAGASSRAGDWVSAGDGLDEAHRFFIEVPPGTRALEVELFDADLLGGAGRPREVDRLRGILDTRVRYELYDPAGERMVTRFVSSPDQRGDAIAGAGLSSADRNWLTFFSSRTATVTGERFADTFDTASYASNAGSRSFSGPWIESGNAPGTGFDRGTIKLRDGRLEISNRGDVDPWLRQPSIERELDLSGFVAANLAFDFATGPGVDPDDSMLVELSSDGGRSYYLLEELVGLAGDTHGRRVYDISGGLSKHTRVRFRVGRFYAAPRESFSVDDLEVRARLAGGVEPSEPGGETLPQPGHWQLVVDMSSRVNPRAEGGGDDVNALGLRTHDGDPGHGGSELSIYTESFLPLGVYGRPGSRQDYALYPYVTAGCSAAVYDFDWDSAPGLRPGSGSLQLVSRSGDFIFRDRSITFSGNGTWNRNPIVGWTTADAATEYGIWSLAVEIADPAAGNFGTLRLDPVVNRDGVASDESRSTRALRIYLPNDRGSAPSKPSFGQSLAFVEGTNPPGTEGRGVYAITLRLVNPAGSAGAIEFAAMGSDGREHGVIARVPEDVAYLGQVEASSGVVAAEPELRSTGEIWWRPDALGPGEVATLVYRVEISFGDIVPAGEAGALDVTGRPGDDGTRAFFLDETGTPVVLGELCQLSVPRDRALPELEQDPGGVEALRAPGTPGGSVPRAAPSQGMIHVRGEVKNPGSFPCEVAMSVLDALALAGGPTPRGAITDAFVRRIEGGEEIRIGVSTRDLLLPGDVLEIPLSSWYE